jgi:hypothetical protein
MFWYWPASGFACGLFSALAASTNVLLGAWPPVLLAATYFVRAMQVERLIFRLFLGFGMKTST